MLWNGRLKGQEFHIICISFLGSDDQSRLPDQCCNYTPDTETCLSAVAKTANVRGCREKVVNFAADSVKTLMWIAICAVLLQVKIKFSYHETDK